MKKNSQKDSLVASKETPPDNQHLPNITPSSQATQNYHIKDITKDYPQHRKSKENFWLNANLYELNNDQWESLCDGCGKCCLEKLEDEDTGIIYTTKVSCRLLNIENCRCNNYKERFRYVDDCIKLTPKKVHQITWLPKTCAYRLVKEGKDLPLWHPLITGDKNSTAASGNSAKEFVIHPVMMTKSMVHYILEEDV
ncbi:YcgN family cysteine cluster protein [Candidatus Hepatincolaceae symbiont of Richtersius coronifer]